MTDAQLRDIYTRALTKRAECPSPDALMALVARTGSEESRLATLDHVMSCAACKQDFELLRAIHAAARPRRWTTARWLAAAVVVIAAGALTVTQLERRPNLVRGAAGSADIALVGATNGALVWRAVPDAVRYEVEIVDASGTTVFHTQATDTTTMMPATLPSGSLSWWVRATLRDGSERRSAIIPVR